MDKNVGVGFDSCSAKTFLLAMKDHKHFNKFVDMAESCESTRFSGYANVEGHFFPCSFTEGEGVWKEGIDLTKIEDFNKDVWQHEKTVAFRNKLCSTTDKSICEDCMECVTFPQIHGNNKFIPVKEIGRAHV